METIAPKEHLLLGIISLLIGGIVLIQILPNRERDSSELNESFQPPFESVFDDFVNQQQLTDLLVQAVIQVESQGNPKAVGSHGERGLMQIMPGTWKETTEKMFGKPLPFDQAFDPVLNKRVGRTYLGILQSSLTRSRDRWVSDERSLLLAGYNAGPSALRRAGYDISKINPSTKRYIQKVTQLHDQLLVDHGHLNEKAVVKQPPSTVAADS